MAIGELIAEKALFAPVAPVLTAVAANVMASQPVGEHPGETAAQLHATTLAIVLHATVAVAILFVVAAGIAASRDPKRSSGPPLVAGLVTFFAYLAGMFALVS